jgi:phytoene dehydrogenase-like protein
MERLWGERAPLRYDACIIGAGADGLAAGAWLAARGLRVIVVERDNHPGGRCATRQFHPGFRASPFVDELPEIPAFIFRTLDLARRGAIFARTAGQTMPAEAAEQRAQVLARVMRDAATVPQRRMFGSARPPVESWPGEDLALRSLDAYGVSAPLDGRLCDPSLAGSALTLLAGADGGMPLGGLGRLGEVLASAAEEAGAEISCGLEVSEIRRRNGRTASAGLADGSEIEARAFISTLDLRRTFLSFFTWHELPRALVERVGAFRTAPGTARLLVALGAPPEAIEREELRAPIRLETADPAAAYRVWRDSRVPQRPPAALRLVSAVDPSLAPDGCATLTITLGAIPHTLFDGAWTHDKRNKLRDAALAMAEERLPGLAGRIVASHLIVPPDIENQIGVTEGDLMGGDASASQMLGFRPFPECSGTRTPVEGLYLAGSSSTLGPLMTCASGVAAANAVLADMRAGRLK